jgi:hypothetical protein
LVDDMSVQTAPVAWFKRPFLTLPVWAWLVALLSGE